MNTDKNGCSTCPAGQEQWDQFYIPRFHKKMYQYEYRHPVTKKLFTTIAPTLALARNRRDLFITEENVRLLKAERASLNNQFAKSPES